jgi:hypothetical protein
VGKIKAVDNVDKSRGSLTIFYTEKLFYNKREGSILHSLYIPYY